MPMLNAQPRLLLASLLLVGGIGLGGSSTVHAQRVAATVDSTTSVIDYTGSAVLHDWTGTSGTVTGTLLLDLDTPDSSRVLVQAPVASFDSGNDTRDANMREVTEADRYPTVSFEATDVESTVWGRSDEGRAGRWTVTGDLTFHGQTHPVEATVDVRATDERVRARTQFPVSLNRFGVERPGLVWGVAPVDDTIRIDARIEGIRQDPAFASQRLDTTRSEVSDTRRVVSTDLRALPASQYAGSRAGLQTTMRRLPDGEREWIVSVYGFGETTTGLADAQPVTLRADEQSVESIRTTGSTRELDDGTIVEIMEMQLPRSGYETLAKSLRATVTIGSTSFSLPWEARRDLRLLLRRTPEEGSEPVSSRDGN